MTEYATERAEALRGLTVRDGAGEEIGTVEEVYVEENGAPKWVGLGTGFFGTKRVLVPFESASLEGDELRVPYTKEQVKDAPDVDEDELTAERERELYGHYGLPYGQPTGGGERDRDRQVDVEAADRELVRHEEELRVGTREEEAGRLRLHKWVETEQVDVPVEVRREKARVTREPVEGAADPGAISDDALEVTLREERPVVEKETVAKERIGIETEVETEQQVVSDEVRRERVDVDER